jgi:hypothetical protein
MEILAGMDLPVYSEAVGAVGRPALGRHLLVELAAMAATATKLP